MLRIAVPKGSLEEESFRLFEQAGLPIRRADDRSYGLSIDDPRISETLLLRPQEIARYVAEGEFDLGITGYDWIKEKAAAVTDVADLPFSKRGRGRVKIVLATDKSNPVNDPKDIDNRSKVVTEYPKITRDYFMSIGKGKISIRLSYGATEVKVPRLADYLVDVVETGETLKKNGKKIIAVIMESVTKLIANPDSLKNDQKRKEINEIKTLLQGALMARGKILIKMNVAVQDIERVIEYLPSLRSPTVSPLAYSFNSKEEWFMVETVVEESELNIILPELKAMGAKDILEMGISKMIL